VQTFFADGTATDSSFPRRRLLTCTTSSGRFGDGPPAHHRDVDRMFRVGAFSGRGWIFGVGTIAVFFRFWAGVMTGSNVSAPGWFGLATPGIPGRAEPLGAKQRDRPRRIAGQVGNEKDKTIFGVQVSAPGRSAVPEAGREASGQKKSPGLPGLF
jgi:hypothetical protein